MYNLDLLSVFKDGEAIGSNLRINKLCVNSFLAISASSRPNIGNITVSNRD